MKCVQLCIKICLEKFTSCDLTNIETCHWVGGVSADLNQLELWVTDQYKSFDKRKTNNNNEAQMRTYLHSVANVLASI